VHRRLFLNAAAASALTFAARPALAVSLLAPVCYRPLSRALQAPRV